MDAPTALDLGSGPSPAPGYVGVDLCQGAPDSVVVYADLWSGAPWPFADGSVDRLRASHVIEHIPHERITIGQSRVRHTVKAPDRPTTVHYTSLPIRQDAFFWFFDQAYRIAKPGCRFELAWPHPLSDAADQDPSHCRRVPVSTLFYLSVEGRRAMAVHHYPVSCDWRVEPGSVMEIGSDESLAPFRRDDGGIDVAAAKRAHGAFHEIRAVLVKPLEVVDIHGGFEPPEDWTAV